MASGCRGTPQLFRADQTPSPLWQHLTYGVPLHPTGQSSVDRMPRIVDLFLGERRIAVLTRPGRHCY